VAEPAESDQQQYLTIAPGQPHERRAELVAQRARGDPFHNTVGVAVLQRRSGGTRHGTVSTHLLPPVPAQLPGDDSEQPCPHGSLPGVEPVPLPEGDQERL
jgi:hypothetical protein